MSCSPCTRSSTSWTSPDPFRSFLRPSTTSTTLVCSVHDPVYSTLFSWSFWLTTRLLSLAFRTLLTDCSTSPFLATKAFDITIAAAEPKVLSGAGVIVGSQISFKEAHERLEDFDIVIVLGGNHDAILKANAEPLDLITAYSKIQEKDPARE